MLVVGLTGGIGSGKTLVSDIFAALGVPIVDADEISRSLVAPGSPTLHQITEVFGQEFITPSGALNRGRMRDHIFADPGARKHLESILHPAIRTEMKRQLSALNGPYAIAVIPLLSETRQSDLVDRVLVVDIPEPLQVQRVMERDQVSRQAAQAVLHNQATRAQRLAIADDILNNEGTPEALQSAVEELHSRYLGLATRFSINGPQDN